MRTAAASDRCSLRSLAAGEPLAGTASTIRRWLLIEHAGPWGRDGLLDARLPEGVGSGLRALERRTGARVLLIRKPDRTPASDDGTVRCFGVDTETAWMGVTPLGRIDEALDLDPRDRSPFAEAAEPVFVVCTHGRRDPCCAERGRPLANALGASFRDVTWESTHVGGDRFAGNLVAFPHGLFFGRVEAADGLAIVPAYTDGRIGSLDRYRGRSRDPFHVQTAERALRHLLGFDRLGDVVRARATRDGTAAEVTFATPIGHHHVRLERMAGPSMRLTCHAAYEEVPPGWRVLRIERDRG